MKKFKGYRRFKVLKGEEVQFRFNVVELSKKY
jgi:hypothetical protein